MSISQVYYNSDRDYLVVIYNNSNIDIILSDGSVVNMPEVKDAIMTQSKTINDVTFADGLIYLATDFGYVVIDDNKFVVKESHIYGKALTSIAKVGEWLLLTTVDNFHYGKADEYHDQFSSFKDKNDSFNSDKKNSRIRPISDNQFFCLTAGWTFRSYFDVLNDSTLYLHNGTTLVENPTTQLQKTKDGYLLNIPSLMLCYKTDNQGLNPEAIETGGELCSANPLGDGTLWAIGEQGLHQLQPNSEYFRPNALSYSTPFWMTYNQGKDLLYVSSASATAFTDTAATYINTFDGIRWENVTPEGAGLSSCPMTPTLISWEHGARVCSRSRTTRLS